MINKDEWGRFCEAFEDLISSSKIDVNQSKWFVENKPSDDNSRYFNRAQEELRILRNSYDDLKWELSKLKDTQ